MADVKNPGLAAVLSALIPGIGQFYNGDFLRGIFWLIITPGLWIGSGGASRMDLSRHRRVYRLQPRAPKERKRDSIIAPDASQFDAPNHGGRDRDVRGARRRYLGSVASPHTTVTAKPGGRAASALHRGVW